MLATLEKNHKTDIDDAYEEQQDLLRYLAEYQDQERFLRHYYNAFKVLPQIKIDKYNRATKSNLIKKYEHFIKKQILLFLALSTILCKQKTTGFGFYT